MSPARPERFDMAVIGGGVAGAACAAILARTGARVGLVHGAASRRATVEMLSGRAGRLLRELDLPAPDGVPIHRTISRWGEVETETREAMFDPYGPGLAIERPAFDGGLREAARAHGAWLMATRARALSRVAGTWQIACDHGAIAAHDIVLATGTLHSPLIPREATSVARQIAFLARGRRVAHARADAAGANGAVGSDDALRVEAAANGWWYALPAPDGSAFAGFCTQAHPRAGERPAWYRRAWRRTETISTFFEPTSDVWGAPASVCTYDRAAGPHWIAIGHAAFSPDPLCGEGLWFALRSARAAADVLSGAQSAADYDAWIANAATAHRRERDEVRSALPTAVPHAASA